MDGIEAKFQQPQPAQPNAPEAPSSDPADDIEREIQTRKQQLAAVREGKIDALYEPEIQAALSSAIARKEGRQVVERENARSGFVNEYNSNLAQAYKDYPDLADPNSELAKETLKILSSDRGYQRVQNALRARGRDAERVDFGVLDPAVTRRAADAAYSSIVRRNGGKPMSQQPQAPNPKLANTALESGSGAPPAPGDDDLARLEKQAVESGDQGDWRRFIKARDTRLKQKAAASV